MSGNNNNNNNNNQQEEEEKKVALRYHHKIERINPSSDTIRSTRMCVDLWEADETHYHSMLRHPKIKAWVCIMMEGPGGKKQDTPYLMNLKLALLMILSTTGVPVQSRLSRKLVRTYPLVETSAIDISDHSSCTLETKEIRVKFENGYLCAFRRNGETKIIFNHRNLGVVDVSVQQIDTILANHPPIEWGFADENSDPTEQCFITQAPNCYMNYLLVAEDDGKDAIFRYKFRYIGKNEHNGNHELGESTETYFVFKDQAMREWLENNYSIFTMGRPDTWVKLHYRKHPEFEAEWTNTPADKMVFVPYKLAMLLGAFAKKRSFASSVMMKAIGMEIAKHEDHIWQWDANGTHLIPVTLQSVTVYTDKAEAIIQTEGELVAIFYKNSRSEMVSLQEWLNKKHKDIGYGGYDSARPDQFWIELFQSIVLDPPANPFLTDPSSSSDDGGDDSNGQGGYDSAMDLFEELYQDQRNSTDSGDDSEEPPQKRSRLQ